LSIKRYLLRRTNIQEKKKQQRFVIIDDFNTNLSSPAKQDMKEKSNEKKKIIEELETKGFIDGFKKSNPEKELATWSSKNIQSRIDTIWVDKH
ncbi:535_t:CDS:1, partial [Racocetra persica]